MPITLILLLTVPSFLWPRLKGKTTNIYTSLHFLLPIWANEFDFDVCDLRFNPQWAFHMALSQLHKAKMS